MSVKSFDHLDNRRDLWRILLHFDRGVTPREGARRRARFVRRVASSVGLGQRQRLARELGVLEAYLALAVLASQFRLSLEKIATAGERVVRKL